MGVRETGNLWVGVGVSMTSECIADLVIVKNSKNKSDHKIHNING